VEKIDKGVKELNKWRRSKDMLRKEEQKIIEEKGKLHSETAKGNLREDKGEELSWDDYDDKKEEELKKCETELEEVQRELGDADIA